MKPTKKSLKKMTVKNNLTHAQRLQVFYDNVMLRLEYVEDDDIFVGVIKVTGDVVKAMHESQHAKLPKMPSAHAAPKRKKSRLAPRKNRVA